MISATEIKQREERKKEKMQKKEEKHQYRIAKRVLAIRGRGKTSIKKDSLLGRELRRHGGIDSYGYNETYGLALKALGLYLEENYNGKLILIRLI